MLSGLAHGTTWNYVMSAGSPGRSLAVARTPDAGAEPDGVSPVTAAVVAADAPAEAAVVVMIAEVVDTAVDAGAAESSDSEVVAAADIGSMLTAERGS